MKKKLDIGNSYGGFWIRVAAYLIDCIVITVPTLAIVFGVFTLSGGDNMDNTESGIYPYLQLISIIAVALYFALFESSDYMATPGKMVVGLVVTDIYGHQISLGRAFGRYFAKLLSMILYIGYIMVAFTEKKRGLHDFIAGTVVTYR